MVAHEVTDTLPWPDGEARDNVGFRYAPDGRTLYFSVSSRSRCRKSTVCGCDLSWM